MNHKFSVIGSKVEIDYEKKLVYKYIKKHECCTTKKAFNFYESYINDWSQYKYFLKSNINIIKEELVITQKLHGSSLIENRNIDLEFIILNLDPILELFEYSRKNKLYADPHIKNFTYDGKEIRFVDISPPYSEEYNICVNNKEKNTLKKYILTKNCEYFRFDWLPYHFAGDLLSVNEEAFLWMGDLYKLFKDLLPRNISKSVFHEKALSIRYHEDKRINLNLNLL